MFLQQQLLQRIEQLRCELHKTVEIFGMDSPQALSSSQQLDYIINQFYQVARCSINQNSNQD
ncbi:Spo0E family sporulation regulatory protein-aspartic acid phosphatase [Sporomusa aerivorans]|uniref:Spo0E family sporulation regulatory protein-aspartic acid phosphatase n=1 Tax=Sporomusa aerivorans TaxID=204936 RepID=UPI00352A022D